MSDEDEQDSAPRIPGWMASFADLMTLLLCFFVLLLSFSEMDVIKYKQVAGSMRHAFGVQSEVPASGIPLGTSIIAQEFSSGRPDPTVENVVQQQTVDNLQMTLEVRQSEEGEALGSFDADEEAARELLISKLISMRADTEADAQALAEVLGKEIADDMIDIESEFRSITIRIMERGSFGSGSSSLNEDFIDVLEKLRNVLSDVEGQISVEGHTDDVPISTESLSSNWHLSSQRALTVGYELLKDDVIDDSRFQIVGYADSKPYASNETPDGRSQNRRVEIVIRQGVDEATSAELRELDGPAQDLLDTLGIEEADLLSRI